MKRLATAGVVVGLVFAHQAPASATPRVLFVSETLQLQGHLTPTRLVLAYISLTDLPLDFRCRATVHGRLYRTHGFLAPHTVHRDRFPTEASRLGGATAICTVHVDDSFTVHWVGEYIEVLGKDFISEPDGDPGTLLIFQNITPESVRYYCTWEEGDPPTTHSSGAVHLAGYSANSIAGFDGAFTAQVAKTIDCTDGLT
jgi:hypothetical protein